MINLKIENARAQINKADLALCQLFADCALNEDGSQTVEITANIKERLNGAPEAMFIAMMRYIDLSAFRHDPAYDDEDDKLEKIQNAETIQLTLAGLIALRAEAILEIAQEKKTARVNNSYDSERHMHHLDNNHFKVYALSESTAKANIARNAFARMMQISVDNQNEYLQNGSGPLVAMAEHRKLTLAA